MDLLKIGQKLSIIFPKGDNIVEIVCTISNIYEDRIALDLPQYFMRYIEYLEVGSSLTAKVFTKVGTIDFNSIVITAPLEDEFSIEIDYNAMKLTPNEDIPVVDAIEPIKISYNDQILNVYSFQISTTFLKITCDYDLKINDTFDCELSLPDNCGIIKFRGTIVDIDEVYYNEMKLVYSNMTEEDRQALIYFMYLYSNSSI